MTRILQHPDVNDEQKSRRIQSNGLAVDCFLNSNGKLCRKIEHVDGVASEFVYGFDARGHLLSVLRNGRLEEQYRYNQAGQRVEQRRAYGGYSDLTAGSLYYDEQGRLERAGGTTFDYDPSGALAARRDCRGVTWFFYGRDTLLDRVILPSREEIRYECDGENPIGPARKFRNGKLVAEYLWLDALRLSGCLDHERQLEYAFSYGKSGGMPDRVRVTPLRSPGWRTGAQRRAGAFGETERKVLSREAGFPAAGASEKCSGPTGRVAQDVRPAGICTDWLGAMVTQERGDRLRELLDRQGGKLDLFCGCDQVGTPKVLTDAKGRVVKEITYDSFGVILHDTLPDLFMPIGFAGGLADSDTGLVRFGYRDYDPAVGRFTAPDPLGDTGGDHDLYDYCIDDPVTLNDPTGLFPPALYALALMGVRALPRLAGMASDLLLRGQAMLHTSKYGNGIITGATRAARFADGYLLPVSPVPASGTGMIGAVAARIVEAIQKQRDNEK